MWLLATVIPIRFSTYLSHEVSHDWINLFIPDNFFAALSKNHVPAVIIACILFGIILQTVASKETFLHLLDTLAEICLNFWKKLVKLMPYATFFLLAYSIGTISLDKLGELGGFIIIYSFVALILILWIYPSLIMIFTPLSYREVFKYVAPALVTAAATTLSVAALPIIVSQAKRLIDNVKNVSELEKSEVVDSFTYICYPFMQIGNYMIYIVSVFSAYFFFEELYKPHYHLLAFISYFASIGSPSAIANSLNFLIQWLPLSPESANLYFSIMPILRYPQVLVSVMAIFSFSIISTMLFFNKGTIKWRLVCFNIIALAVLSIVYLIVSTQLIPPVEQRIYQQYQTLDIANAIKKGVNVSYSSTQDILNKNNTENRLTSIQKNGYIRVGYNASMLPFCYFNEKRHLVGFDVALIYRIAQNLKVDIKWVPFEFNNLIKDINSNRFDIAIGGIYLTHYRTKHVEFSDPYFQSHLTLIIRQSEVSRFSSVASINKGKNIRIVSFDDPILLPIVKHNFPNAKIVLVKKYTASVFQRLVSGEVDAIVWSKPQAKVWSYGFPSLTYTVPQKFDHLVLFSFLLPKGESYFKHYINYTLKELSSDGFINKQKNYWIYSHPRSEKISKWNLIDWLYQVII